MKRTINPDIGCNRECEEINNKVAVVERNNTPGDVTLRNVWSVTKKSPTDLMELAYEIENADNYVKATACSKLQIIAEQIRMLQKKAHDVFLKAQRDNKLHHVACNFVKIPGKVYHLYCKASGQEYFSMLSPEEWGNSPDQFIGSFRMEYDRSWTEANDINDKDKEIRNLQAILDNSMDM